MWRQSTFHHKRYLWSLEDIHEPPTHTRLIVETMSAASAASDPDMRELFGLENVNLVLKNARDGVINDQKLAAFAQEIAARQMDTRVVFGNHSRRMGRGPSDGDIEMRAILCDWYQVELYELKPETGDPSPEAIRLLITVLDPIDRFTANQLRRRNSIPILVEVEEPGGIGGKGASMHQQTMFNIHGRTFASPIFLGGQHAGGNITHTGPQVYGGGSITIGQYAEGNITGSHASSSGVILGARRAGRHQCAQCADEGRRVSAGAYCKHCEDHLCVECGLAHKKNRVTKLHEIVFTP